MIILPHGSLHNSRNNEGDLLATPCYYIWLRAHQGSTPGRLGANRAPVDERRTISLPCRRSMAAAYVVAAHDGHAQPATETVPVRDRIR